MASIANKLQVLVGTKFGGFEDDFVPKMLLLLPIDEDACGIIVFTYYILFNEAIWGNILTRNHVFLAPTWLVFLVAILH